MALNPAVSTIKENAVKRRGSMFDASALRLNPVGSSICTFADDPGDMFTMRRPTVHYQNTYKMEPDSKFESGRAKKIAEEILSDHLFDIQYNANDCRYQCKEISDKIKQAIKALGYKRHKIVVVVNIGQLNNQGVRFGSRCLWDDKRDNWAEVVFKNTTLWATATIYALYFE